MEKQIIQVGNYFVLNGKILPIEGFSYAIPVNAKIIYEVIRIKNATPLFFKQHLDRLFNSIKLLGLYKPDKIIIKGSIVDLLCMNPVTENNIRLSLIYNSSNIPDILIYFIPSNYPTLAQRDKGVSVKTINAFRENPNAKIENTTLREKADLIIGKSVCYEVLLVDNEKYITEGSRSNIFFIKDDSLYTPPLGMVLGGITRQVLINLSKEFNIPCIEEKISIDQLQGFESSFLTGTSPGVLPISSIDNKSFMVNSPILQKLIEGYNNAIAMDIINFTKK